MHRLRIFILIALLATACTPLPTPAVPGRETYENEAGFSIQYPGDWERFDGGGHTVAFAMQAPPGTTLLEKRMEIDVRDLGLDCKQTAYDPDGMTEAPKAFMTEGGTFLVETGAGVAAGNLYEWTSYSTLRGFNCVTITFLLHSANPGVYATPPPAFDKAAESVIFDELLGTFRPRRY